MADNFLAFKDMATTAIDLSGATVTTFATLADGSGATVGAFSNDDPTTDAPDGYLTITVGGTAYKIPMYADDA